MENENLDFEKNVDLRKEGIITQSRGSDRHGRKVDDEE